ncbi:MAG: glycerophosphodiester phosphodiesterase [Desulfobacteraceae bacterium]|nr:MAG: glycerophosphodiester phosphodiesterase [Desulfobacteraceae bacterium]
MRIPPVIEHGYMRLMDAVFARWPQPTPTAEALGRARIISHRGEYDNVTVKENTLAAFKRAQTKGVWGIELDVRWSSDLVPVVVHDADLRRLYGIQAQVARFTRQQLRQRVPDIPSLAEVVELLGRRQHLMIEIKETVWPDAPRQSRILKEILSGLSPVEHYHFMALHPLILTPLDGFPLESYLAIAYHWPDRLSRWVRQRPWGGLCAHYAMMRNALIEKHKHRGQKVGTAYPASRKCLFRELNRGVDWIFSNHAGKLQGILAGQRSLLQGAERKMP